MSKNLPNLKAILDSIYKIQRYSASLASASELFRNEINYDAILMNFIIGESVGRLSGGFKQKITQISWSEIKGFRNIVAHNYFGVDPEELWDLIENHLPALQKQDEHIVTNIEKYDC